MRTPRLDELPDPGARTGWPWIEETPPPSDGEARDWPSLSIVIPSFNQGKFVEETLRAILLQGYPDLELIFAEDASTDDTLEVIEPYRPWMTFLPSSVNRGMSNAINRGFRIARGQIVTWISTDDVYRKGTFHRVARAWLENRECGALIGGFQFIDPESNPSSEPFLPRLGRPAPLDLTVEPLESWRLHQVSTFYTDRGLEDAGRYVREELLYVMDRDLLFRVARKRSLVLLDETLADFRLHPASKSVSSTKILDFAREFANLQLAYLTGDRHQDRRRRRIARERRVKGYLRYGTRGDRFGKRFETLALAGLMQPGLLLRRSYMVRWLDLLGLGGPLRSLRGQAEDATP
ncbi:MAG: glycosyltransferase [Acidobacteria bacterium]|nr:glycosyltransferase [Acidobacteriota bacterium]